MNSNTLLNLMVFIINVLFLTVIALFAVWGFFSIIFYYIWLAIGIVSAIWFAFYFRRFTNGKEFMIKSLLHGTFIYTVLIVFNVIQAVLFS